MLTYNIMKYCVAIADTCVSALLYSQTQSHLISYSSVLQVSMTKQLKVVCVSLIIILVSYLRKKYVHSWNCREIKSKRVVLGINTINTKLSKFGHKHDKRKLNLSDVLVITKGRQKLQNSSLTA